MKNSDSVDPYGQRIMHPEELGISKSLWVSPISFNVMGDIVFCVGDPCCPAGWYLHARSGEITCAGEMRCNYTESECAMSYLASGGRWSPTLERKPEVLPECERLPKSMTFLIPLYFWPTGGCSLFEDEYGKTWSCIEWEEAKARAARPKSCKEEGTCSRENCVCKTEWKWVHGFQGGAIGLNFAWDTSRPLETQMGITGTLVGGGLYACYQKFTECKGNCIEENIMNVPWDWSMGLGKYLGFSISDDFSKFCFNYLGLSLSLPITPTIPLY